MPVIQIQLDEALQSRLAARAAECGYANEQAYVESLVRADAGEEITADPDLESLLLSRLASGPPIELTPDFIRKFKEDLARRRQSPGSIR